MIKKESQLWQYLAPEMRTLASDGAFLVSDSARHHDTAPTDFSFLVFPFAKLYEGFLKQLFHDLHIISDQDYQSDHFRIGKVLSPNLVRRLGGRSAYGQIEHRWGHELADKLWFTWKQSRNQVFHYFPHNYRALTRQEAIGRIDMTIASMEEAVNHTHVLDKG